MIANKGEKKMVTTLSFAFSPSAGNLLVLTLRYLACFMTSRFDYFGSVSPGFQ